MDGWNIWEEGEGRPGKGREGNGMGWINGVIWCMLNANTAREEREREKESEEWGVKE